jgi:hypothetical protein
MNLDNILQTFISADWMSQLAIILFIVIAGSIMTGQAEKLFNALLSLLKFMAESLKWLGRAFARGLTAFFKNGNGQK